MRAPGAGWGGLREAVGSQRENVTRCVQEFVRAQGQEDTEGLCPHPAGPDMEGGPCPLGVSSDLPMGPRGCGECAGLRAHRGDASGPHRSWWPGCPRTCSSCPGSHLCSDARPGGRVRGQWGCHRALHVRALSEPKYGPPDLSPSLWVPPCLPWVSGSSLPWPLPVSLFLSPAKQGPQQLQAQLLVMNRLASFPQRLLAQPRQGTLSRSLSCSKWLASTSGWSWAGGSTQWPTSFPSSRPSLFRSRKSRNCSRSVWTQAGSSSPGSSEYRSAGVGKKGRNIRGHWDPSCAPIWALMLTDRETPATPFTLFRFSFFCLNGINNKTRLTGDHYASCEIDYT